MFHRFSRTTRDYRVVVGETSDEPEIVFRSSREAAAFLRRESHAAGAMRGYRRVLEAARTGVDMGRLSDEEVLLRLASLLARRRVRLHHGKRVPLKYRIEDPTVDEPSAIGPVEGFGIVGELEVAAAPLYDVDLTANEPPLIEVGVELGTLPDEENDVELDTAAQAATLQEAAAAGAPFCEECEKARLAALNEAPPPVEEDEAVASMDAPAQAAALQQAAAAGAPFCEECEKARRAALQAGAAEDAGEEEAEDEAVASMDVATQAATLREAAASGVPFCEECEKAKAAAAAA